MEIGEFQLNILGRASPLCESVNMTDDLMWQRCSLYTPYILVLRRCTSDHP